MGWYGIRAGTRPQGARVLMVLAGGLAVSTELVCADEVVGKSSLYFYTCTAPCTTSKYPLFPP